MHNYREMKIWQKGRILVKEVYLITQTFPKEERFGLTSQAQRAAVSIPLNISEGAGRGTNKDFNNFLDMARGSVNELETLIFLSNDLEYINSETTNLLLQKTEELSKMIVAFQAKLSKI
ncbi:MAG: four helix bundle protein [Prolixibacteraceae bacterium]|jgi:four helix bundle protein|nr:four helix bundle protein [Prolixibacteraceae bacterium]